MIAVIWKNGQELNRIVSDEAFAADYCSRTGCTYTMEETPEPEPVPEPEERYTAEDMLRALMS